MDDATPTTLSALERAVAAVERGEVVAVATVTSAPEGAPVALGFSVVVELDGRLDASTGDDALDAAVAELAREAMRTGRPVHLAWPERGDDAVGVYIEPYEPAPSVVVCGAGHIGVPLAAMARLSGYHVTVIDDRPDYANAKRFPTADRILAEPFDEALAHVSITPRTAIVLVTRGHRYDWDCLRAVIDSRAGYIGMIGSRRRVRAALLGLEREGFTREHLERVSAPIGLDIGSETPEEIAVAILAEIILARRGGTGRPLSRIPSRDEVSHGD